MKLQHLLYGSAALSVISGTASAQTTNINGKLPNIVMIVADDMGYADVGCNSRNGYTKTPNIDTLTREGVSFTHAYSSSGVSTPSRYGFLTGRYCFRSPLKKGAIEGYGAPVIEKGRMTLGSLLHKGGYTTAIIGKWHQGLGWVKDDSKIDGVDFSKTVTSGPNDYGFDYSFILPASLDMPPYVYMRNHVVLDQNITTMDKLYPTRKPGVENAWDTIYMKGNDIYWGRGVWWRNGAASESFRVENTLQTFTAEAENYLEQASKQDKPFFMYMPLTSPHTPWVADSLFKGTSDVGDYGDFVTHTDYVVGRIKSKIKELGLLPNTIIIFTSDNGAAWREADINKWKHNPNEGTRGQKGDVYDGGHHIPLVVSWNGVLSSNVVTDDVSLVDIFATMADLIGYDRKMDEGEDSYSLMPLFTGNGKYGRDHIIYHSSGGMYAIAKGDWKYIRGLGSGGFSAPQFEKAVPGGPVGQLYNMRKDPLEKENVYMQYPEKVAELSKQLEEVIDGDDKE